MTTPDDEIRRQVLEWRHAQAITLATGSFSLAGLTLSPMLAAAFDADARFETSHAVLGRAPSLMAAASGLMWHRRAARLGEDCVAESDAACEKVLTEAVV